MKARRLVRGVDGAVLAVTLLIVVLVAALVRLELRGGTPAGIEPPVEAVITEAAAASGEVVRPIELQIELAPGAVALAPAWSGLVTEVLVQPGQLIVTGAPVAAVDGIERLAVSSPAPFHRPLALGDRGPDVTMLADVLLTLGRVPAAAAAGDTFDATLASAVAGLARDLGAEVGQPASFDPSWFVWMPGDDLVVAQVSLTTAAPAPAPGQAALTFTPAVAAVRVPADRLPPAEAGLAPELGIRIGDVEAEVIDGIVELSPELAAALATSITVPAAAETDTSAPGVTSVPAELVMRWPDDLTRVPLTALVTTGDGLQCLVAETGESREARMVSVVGSETASGVALIVGIDAGSPVVVNPVAAHEAGTCLTSGSAAE